MITVYLYGETKLKPWQKKALAEYSKRLSKTCKIIQKPLTKAPSEALFWTSQGKPLDSVALSKLISDQLQQSSSLHLAVDPTGQGGYLLTSPALTQGTSLVLFIEQLYRGFKIAANESYHK